MKQMICVYRNLKGQKKMLQSKYCFKRLEGCIKSSSVGGGKKMYFWIYSYRFRFASWHDHLKGYWMIVFITGRSYSCPGEGVRVPPCLYD